MVVLRLLNFLVRKLNENYMVMQLAYLFIMESSDNYENFGLGFLKFNSSEVRGIST